MNNKKRIYAVLEVKERELLGKILFGINMSNLGYSVVIGKKNSLYAYQKYLKSGIYYFKGMGKKNIKPMKDLISNGHKIVGFDEEGMVSHNPSIIPNRVNKDCMRMVEFFFTVGEIQQKNTLKVYPEYKNKIYQIGNPRFDVVKKNNNNFYSNEVKAVKKKYGKFVIFATQLTLLNNHLIKDIFKFFRSRKNVQDKNLNFFEALHEFEVAIEKKWKKFLIDFPKKNPGIKILIKPHPVENRQYWLKLLKKIGCKNLILASEEFSTNSYLIASEFNVASNCHTTLESYILGKPSINLRAKKKDSIYVSKLIRAVASKDILNIEQLDKLIREWFYKKKKFSFKLPKKKKIILNKNVKNINKESFYFFEKRIRSIQIDPINKIDKYTNPISFMYFRYMKKLKNLYYARNQSKDEFDFYAKKFSGLNIEEFKFNVKKFSTTLNYDFKKFSVKEIYPGCFSIEKNFK